jgi:BON domain
MMVELKRISTALGLLAVLTGSALAQGPTPNANQVTADSVAGTLRSSRDLAGYRIEIQARDGVVTLTGELGSPAQKAEALARTQYVAGVRSVVDHLLVSNDRSIRTVQYQPNPVQYQPNPAEYQPNPALAFGLGHGGHGPISGDVVYGSGPAGQPNAGPITSGRGSGGLVNDGGPTPEGPAGMAGATQASQPGSPNYAWPSYAPYPNFSAVGYPTAYPWQAWPNIGPFYPYPEVPLDWRAVTLRWDDGIWWLDFKKHYTRPFITPYPFGLFAY